MPAWAGETITTVSIDAANTCRADTRLPVAEFCSIMQQNEGKDSIDFKSGKSGKAVRK
jgi:hypothetical protein